MQRARQTPHGARPNREGAYAKRKLRWARAGSARHNLRVGRLSCAVMRSPEEWPSCGSNPADRIRLTGPAAFIFSFYCSTAWLRRKFKKLSHRRSWTVHVCSNTRASIRMSNFQVSHCCLLMARSWVPSLAWQSARKSNLAAFYYSIARSIGRSWDVPPMSHLRPRRCVRRAFIGAYRRGG